MASVEMRLGLVTDEELAAVAVRPGVGHREGSGLMGLRAELVLEGVTGTASTAARGVAALCHKARDHAVKDDAVVEAIARQEDEIVDGFGCVLWEQLDLDVALVGLHRRR